MESGRDYDHFVKLLMLGYTFSGKSCLLKRFADDYFDRNQLTTIGVDFKILNLDINGERVKLQIWDTNGTERFDTVTHKYYRGSHGVILVYDINNGHSFAHIEK